MMRQVKERFRKGGASSTERRLNTRKLVRIPVKFTVKAQGSTGEAFPLRKARYGVISNLDLGGANIHTDKRVLMGTQLCMEFEIVRGGIVDHIEANARVCWLEEHGFAVRFDRLSPESLESVVRIISGCN